MTPLRIVVCGVTGRMGATILRACGNADDVAVVGGIGENANGKDVVPVHDSAGLLAQADALIDFSAPAAIDAVLANAGTALDGKAIVIGTTGLTAEHEKRIDAVAKKAAVVTAANFSVGVNLLLDLVERAARVLDDRFDIEIVEAHHRNKVDAPSGTALALARAAALGRGVTLEDMRRDGRSGDTGARPAGEIALHAMRGGSVVGEHHVHFLGSVERIELSHIATDRILFAEGALTAARWAHGRAPGRYTMRDVLGLQE